MAGGGGVASTSLTANITATSDSIPVKSTVGFLSMGEIVIGDERIAYSSTDATHFKDTIVAPMVRGSNNTASVAHSTNATVYTVEASKVNASMNYSIASISASSGLWIMVTLPLALIRMFGQFVSLPISFLGTDLQILTWVWAALGIGAIISFSLALSSSRMV